MPEVPSVEGRQALAGIKPYVPGKPIEEVERELGISNVIKLASNENPLGPSPDAVVAIREIGEKVYLYPDGACHYLRQAVADHLRLTPAHLIIGNGSDEILKLIAEAYLEPDDEIIMADPSFSEYEFVARVMGAGVVKVPTRDFRHDLEAMAGKITERTKLIFVCNPNNPTGTIVSRQEVEAFLSKVPPGVVVIFDEAYHEYVSDAGYPASLEYIENGRSNVIVLRTFSKIYGLAGLRVGYGVAVPEVIAWINRAREPFNVNIVAQAAALAALKDQLHVDHSRRVNEEGKSYLYGRFDEMGLSYVPTEANFILVNVRADSRQVFREMLQEGVIIRTGDIFGLDQWIRVTIGTRRQNQRFADTLDRVLSKL